MKKFIAIFALVLSTMAAADSTLIFETKNYSNYDVSTSFGVNKEMGRAWAVVTLAEWSGDSSYYTDERVQIEGLSYNAETKEIVLEKNGEQIVCAGLYNRRFVIDGGNSVRMTGRCKFSVKKTKITEDNGFETYKVPVLQVYLNVE